MEKKTVQYKRTLRGSVMAGVGALVNGDGRRYYILEHKDASKYHKAGESQKIIIDQIELGRDSSCQVRYDDSFPTVSRRHAAIVKDGEGWKLVQLSQTNTTFLNGQPVATEWYLQNGDEIQLSAGGPRVGFIVPAGKQSLVSSIRLTERMELFRKQALRPYKTAISCLFALLVLLGCGAGYVINSQSNEIKDLFAKLNVQKEIFDKAQEQYKKDSTEFANQIANAKKQVRKIVVRKPEKQVQDMIDEVKNSVYAVQTTVYLSDGKEKKKISFSQGTGFLTNDGRFVTARHCVEPWMFDVKELQAAYALANSSEGLLKIYSTVVAINMQGETMEFRSTDFKMDKTYDSPLEVPYELEGQQITLKGGIAISTKASLGNDWAYVQSSRKGAIKDGRSMSAQLKSGTPAHILGFPQSLGIMDGANIVNPIYNILTISRDGLNEGRCIMVNQGVDHGNSGGPVFVAEKGQLYVIGIVSRGDINSDYYNHLTPMSNLK